MGKKKQHRADPNRKARRRAQLKARDNDLAPFPGRDADHRIGLVGTIVMNADYHQHDDGTWTATVAPELMPGVVTIDDVDLHTVFHKVIAVVEVLAETAPPGADISTITLHHVDGDTLRWIAAVDEHGFTDCVVAAQFPDHRPPPSPSGTPTAPSAAAPLPVLTRPEEGGLRSGSACPRPRGNS